MANFERAFHFESFVPNLGDNRELRADQLTLQLACGMTKLELQRFKDAPKALKGISLESPTDAADLEAMEVAFWEKSSDVLAAKWEPFVRLGPGNHSLNGKPLATLRDYLRFAVEQPGAFSVIELINELTRLNSIEGTRALFFPLPAGGSTSTAPRNTAPAESQTGGH